MRKVAGAAWTWVKLGVVIAVGVPMVLLLAAAAVLFGIAFVQWVLEAPPVAWFIFFGVLSLPVIVAALDR